MASEWKVTCNVIDGRTLYGVYRLIDTSEVDHSGNREMYGGYDFQLREAAQALARLLNSHGKAARQARKGDGR
jgi:hypothetical protein